MSKSTRKPKNMIGGKKPYTVIVNLNEKNLAELEALAEHYAIDRTAAVRLAIRAEHRRIKSQTET